MSEIPDDNRQPQSALGGSGSAAAVPSGLVAIADCAPTVSLAEVRLGLAFYLFVEPFSGGKVVVDLSSGGGPGGEILRKSGAVDVLSPGKPGLPLPFPDGGADVVVGAMPTSAVGDDRQRATLLSDIRRIMRPDGMCILRATALALEGVAVGGSLRATLTDMMLEHFATVDIVEETPFRAVSYFVPGSDDLAVSEAMAKVGGTPSHLIALCTPALERTWHLSESLLVPIGPGDEAIPSEGELAAWRAEVERLTLANVAVARERDGLRERQMTLQDQSERVEKTVAALRRDVERYLRQIGDDAAARELLTLERDHMRRKLTAVEAEADSVTQDLERQKSTVQALRKEVDRLRAARGQAPGVGR
jgi:regulator of replication initiation timing/SAM-dependent methyltransferase